MGSIRCRGRGSTQPVADDAPTPSLQAAVVRPSVLPRRTAWVLAMRLAGLWLGLSAIAAAQDAAPSGDAGPNPQPTLRVLTWNVLASSPAEMLLGWLGWDGKAKRSRALLHEAKALNPDILAFQEVTTGFLAALAADPAWAGYHACAKGPEAPPGGLLVLSRHPIAKVAYRKLHSALGRYALFTTLYLHGEALVVANVHLESLSEDHAARKAQLTFVEARLPSRGLTLWLGDFNFADLDPEARQIADWTDAWARLRPGEAGHSYDPQANPLARKHGFAAEPGRRIDRILSSRRLVPIAAGLIGKDRAEPPSDHYGLWADLAPSPAHAAPGSIGPTQEPRQPPE